MNSNADVNNNNICFLKIISFLYNIENLEQGPDQKVQLFLVLFHLSAPQNGKSIISKQFGVFHIYMAHEKICL